MSIDGFVVQCQRRLEVLRGEIHAIIKRDGGKKIYSHMRNQLAEVDSLNKALYKAQRKGVRE